MITSEIIALVNTQFPVLDLEADKDGVVIVSSQFLLQICQFLNEAEGLYFDQLACITGIDNRAADSSFEVVYNLYSITLEHSIIIKVKLEEEDPKAYSIVPIWKAADWLEREVYDMYGIHFENHPDLRRILMPANWEGFPLRKDYKTQEYYHGIKVDY